MPTEKKERQKKKRRAGETTVQKKRKQILGEKLNSGSHKKDEIANENRMDVPKTMKVLIKWNRWQAFADAFKKSTNTDRAGRHS